MKRLLRLLPQSLLERVFALYCIGLLTFVLAGLGSFYYQQFTEAIAGAHESAALLTEVVAPTITDSAVIGDYDTVKRTLEKVLLRSVFESAAFLDVGGGVIYVESQRADRAEPPAWLEVMVMRRLFDVNRNISAGGRDYGVVRLKFSSNLIAGELWAVTRTALLIAAACVVFGIGLIRIPLRRWLGNLDRLQTFEWEEQAGAPNPQTLLAEDAPREIRQTFDVLNRTATSLQIQRARAEVTLGAIADGVITVDSQGNIVYANPIAIRLFRLGAGSHIGQSLKTALPEVVAGRFEDLPAEGVRNLRVEYRAPSDDLRMVECSWTPIVGMPGKAAGYVLTCRDVTETHRLDVQLRAELESRRAALDALQDVMRGLGAEADWKANSSDDIATVAQIIGRLTEERGRVTALLEDSVRELGYQKRALDAHSIVTITDAAGTITYANEKFTEISGYDSEELIGQNHRFMKSGLHSAQFYREMWDTISAGRVWHGQIGNRRKNGEIYWAAQTIVPWLGDDGRPYQYVAIRTDITDQKKIAQDLAEAKQRELETGTSIQRSLLKDEVPEGIPGAWIANFTEPSQGIDGDFYAIRQFRHGCFEILVGDVMGKGVPAALIGAGIKAAYNRVMADLLAVRMKEGLLPAPAEIINKLHQILTPRLIDLSSFATLALYRFDLDAGTLTFVNAGHTPLLLSRASEGRVIPVMGDNLPIGVMAEEEYVQSTVSVAEGDSFILFSDGITDARNWTDEEFGMERLVGLLEAATRSSLPPTIALHAVRGVLRRFVGSDQSGDDQTAFAIQLRARRRSRRGNIEQRRDPFVFTLPWTLDALATLRANIEESAWFLSTEDASALTLASFEAGSNILRHAPPMAPNPTLTCRVTRQDQTLTVELIYPSETFSPPAELAPDFSGKTEGGFGLYIIDKSVDSVEYGSPLPFIGRIRLVKHASAMPEHAHQPE